MEYYSLTKKWTFYTNKNMAESQHYGEEKKPNTKFHYSMI